MKPLLMRHSEPIDESFKIWHNGNPYRHNPWHYHPECEITYISKGKGVLFIGDQMMEYGNDELVILGPNLPHEWRSDVGDSPDLYSDSASIHFSQNFLGDYFYTLPEASLITKLLDHSIRGIKITDVRVKKELKTAINALRSTTGLPRIYKLLHILHVISVSDHPVYLSSNSFVASLDQDSDQRIQLIYQYVMKNFKRTLTIDESASVINMTATSFCRFFKERTHKSFVAYLHEVRVGYACRLLLEGKQTVSQVAYESGFGNISNFNKQFLKIKKLTPVQFVKSRET